jgi:hypothetical protein
VVPNPAYGGHDPRRPPASRKGLGDGIKQKDLIGIPWRVALALQADGWYLRSDIIWHKSNPMPESVTDRPTKAHEYIFVLSKSERYYYDARAIAEPVAPRTVSRPSQDIEHQRGSRCRLQDERCDESVWTDRLPKQEDSLEGRDEAVSWGSLRNISTRADRAVHPGRLTTRGHCADPFLGSGTTAAVALIHGRQYVGIELNPAYIELATARIENVNLRFYDHLHLGDFRSAHYFTAPHSPGRLAPCKKCPCRH